MPRREKYVPKHRSAPPEPAVKRGVRKSVLFSGVAVTATGIAVAGGVLAKEKAPADPAAETIAAARVDRLDERSESGDRPVSVEAVQERRREASRSDRRTPLAKQELLDEESGGQMTRTEDLADLDPREIARRLMPEYGLSLSEFGCLDQLWISESDWRVDADNPTSSAYGIPQALTAGTHDNLPEDYMTNPVSQIRWGLWYIKDSYGSACSAWEFKQANDWY